MRVGHLFHAILSVSTQKTMKGFYSPEEQGTWDPTKEIVVNMDGGVGGSWKELTEEEEAASLEITVDELRQRKSNPVPLKKLPHQRLHGH